MKRYSFYTPGGKLVGYVYRGKDGWMAAPMNRTVAAGPFATPGEARKYLDNVFI